MLLLFSFQFYSFSSHSSLRAPQNLCSLWHLLCQRCATVWVRELCERTRVYINCQMILRLCIYLFITDMCRRRRNRSVCNCSIARLEINCQNVERTTKKAQQQGVRQRQQQIHIKINRRWVNACLLNEWLHQMKARLCHGMRNAFLISSPNPINRNDLVWGASTWLLWMRTTLTNINF